MKNENDQNSCRREFSTQNEIMGKNKQGGKIRIGKVFSCYTTIRRKYVYDIDRVNKSDEKAKAEDYACRSYRLPRIPDGEYIARIVHYQVNNKRKNADEVMFILRIVKSLDRNETPLRRSIFYFLSLSNGSTHFDELAYEVLDRYDPETIYLSDFMNKEIQIRTLDRSYDYAIELVRKKL